MRALEHALGLSRTLRQHTRARRGLAVRGRTREDGVHAHLRASVAVHQERLEVLGELQRDEPHRLLRILAVILGAVFELQLRSLRHGARLLLQGGQLEFLAAVGVARRHSAQAPRSVLNLDGSAVVELVLDLEPHLLIDVQTVVSVQTALAARRGAGERVQRSLELAVFDAADAKLSLELGLLLDELGLFVRRAAGLELALFEAGGGLRQRLLQALDLVLLLGHLIPEILVFLLELGDVIAVALAAAPLRLEVGVALALASSLRIARIVVESVERRGLGGAAVHGAASAAAALLLCGFLGPAVDGDPPRGIDLHRRAEIHHVGGHRRRVKQRGEVHAAERPLAQAGRTLAGLAAVAIAEDLRFGLVQELDGLVARRVERRAVDDIRQELLQHVIINLRGALLDPLVLRVLPDGGRHGGRERIKANSQMGWVFRGIRWGQTLRSSGATARCARVFSAFFRFETSERGNRTLRVREPLVSRLGKCRTARSPSAPSPNLGEPRTE